MSSVVTDHFTNPTDLMSFETLHSIIENISFRCHVFSNPNPNPHLSQNTSNYTAFFSHLNHYKHAVDNGYVERFIFCITPAPDDTETFSIDIKNGVFVNSIPISDPYWLNKVVPNPTPDTNCFTISLGCVFNEICPKDFQLPFDVIEVLPDLPLNNLHDFETSIDLSGAENFLSLEKYLEPSNVNSLPPTQVAIPREPTATSKPSPPCSVKYCECQVDIKDDLVKLESCMCCNRVIHRFCYGLRQYHLCFTCKGSDCDIIQNLLRFRFIYKFFYHKPLPLLNLVLDLSNQEIVDTINFMFHSKILVTLPNIPLKKDGNTYFGVGKFIPQSNQIYDENENKLQAGNKYYYAFTPRTFRFIESIEEPEIDYDWLESNDSYTWKSFYVDQEEFLYEKKTGKPIMHEDYNDSIEFQEEDFPNDNLPDDNFPNENLPDEDLQFEESLRILSQRV